MNMYILRQRFFEKTTEGLFLLNDVRAGFTLEDRVRDFGPGGKGKIPKETAIPAGHYEVELYDSPHFKKLLPHIINVPYFDGVLLHGGNTEEDTEGCPLIAANRIVDKHKIFGNVTDSIVAILQGNKGKHYIDIIDCFPGIWLG